MNRPWLKAAAPEARLDAQASRKLASGTIVAAFVLFQIACQLALLSSALASVRVAFRIAAFAASLVLLLLPARGKPHPAAVPALVVLLILGLELLHPETRALAGVAQAVLALAILAPLFWVPRVHATPALFRKVVLIFFVFHATSAGVGVLQAVFPGTFDPSISTVLERQGQDYLDSLRITLESGERVYRPMGLTDTPGGAATGGFYALLLGLGFFLSTRRFVPRLFCAAAMGVGMTALYLGHVRSVLVRLAISVAALGLVLLWRRRFGKVVATFVVVATIVLGGFVVADSLAGRSVSKRLASLVEGDPGQVYYEHRGIFLEYTVKKLLPAYPLGAGLGRWGMANAYFGERQDPSLWVEIQWTGWLLDGGVPLVLAYAWTIVLALLTASRALEGKGDAWVWGSVVFAYDVGAFVNTFTYPVFAGQNGLEFWLLNALVFAAYRDEAKR